MRPFEFNPITKTYFGNHIVEEVVKKETETFGNRALIVSTGGSLHRLGYIDQLKGWIPAETLLYDKITPDPDVAEIREAVSVGKENNVSCVVGFGGGSAIDAAKATAIGIVSERDIEEYLLDGITPPQDTLPIVAIPTTSGTGAELSKGAIISCRQRKMKGGIRGERIIPKVAIVDPTYTFSLPMHVTMESGFDVLAHAIESYCAVQSNYMSEMISESVIKTVGEWLPKLSKDLQNLEAREKMSYASHVVGYNLRSVGNCLPHRLQYPISVSTGTSHGAGLIALFPAWIRFETEVRSERIKTALDILGCPNANSTERRFRLWLNNLKIARTLADLGNIYSAEELTKMVSGNIQNDRLSERDGIIQAIYEESM